MKKYIGLFIAAVMTFTFCAIGCDTEEGGSSSSSGSGSGNGKTSITGFTVTPSGTIEMNVDETKDFTIAYQPANATFNPADLTYDMDTSYLQVVPELIKFSSGSISITVKAIKAGTTTVNASLISNPKIKGSIKFDIKGADSSGSGDEGIPADVTTLDVTVTCTDLTMDSIHHAEFWFDKGNYASKKQAGSLNWTKKTVPHSKLTVEYEGRNGTVKFQIVDEGLGTEMKMYYYVKLLNEDDVSVGTLEDVYQDTRDIKPETKYTLSLESNGVYGDAAIELN